MERLCSDPALVRYPYLAATRADLLARLGRRAEAQSAYDEALALVGNEVERRFLQRRRTMTGD